MKGFLLTALIIIGVLSAIIGIIVANLFAREETIVRTAKEMELYEAIKDIEMIKIGLPFATEYSLIQGSMRAGALGLKSSSAQKETEMIWNSLGYADAETCNPYYWKVYDVKFPVCPKSAINEHTNASLQRYLEKMCELSNAKCSGGSVCIEKKENIIKACFSNSQSKEKEDEFYCAQQCSTFISEKSVFYGNLTQDFTGTCIQLDSPLLKQFEIAKDFWMNGTEKKLPEIFIQNLPDLKWYNCLYDARLIDEDTHILAVLKDIYPNDYKTILKEDKVRYGWTDEKIEETEKKLPKENETPEIMICDNCANICELCYKIDFPCKNYIEQIINYVLLLSSDPAIILQIERYGGTQPSIPLRIIPELEKLPARNVKFEASGGLTPITAITFIAGRQTDFGYEIWDPEVVLSYKETCEMKDCFFEKDENGNPIRGCQIIKCKFEDISIGLDFKIYYTDFHFEGDFFAELCVKAIIPTNITKPNRLYPFEIPFKEQKFNPMYGVYVNLSNNEIFKGDKIGWGPIYLKFKIRGTLKEDEGRTPDGPITITYSCGKTCDIWHDIDCPMKPKDAEEQERKCLESLPQCIPLLK